MSWWGRCDPDPDPPPLHVFGNDYEWVCAYSLEDIKRLFEENPGWPPPDDFDFSDWEQLPDNKTKTIWCDKSGQPTEPHSDGSEQITLTCREWCERVGRTYLCTTEY